MSIIINFNNGGTMVNGYYRMWDGTKLTASNWELYDKYTKAVSEGKAVVSVTHSDGTFTDIVRI